MHTNGNYSRNFEQGTGWEGFIFLEMVPVSCIAVTGHAPSQGLEGEVYPLSGAVGLGVFVEGAPWAAVHHRCILPAAFFKNSR